MYLKKIKFDLKLFIIFEKMWFGKNYRLCTVEKCFLLFYKIYFDLQIRI